MNLFIISALMVVGSNVAYHICQKTIPSNLHPMVSIIITFSVATLCSILLLPVFISKSELMNEIQKVNLSPVLLGVAIVGIDVGYLLFYRSGWNISTGTLFTYVSISLLLLPIGLLLFQEVFSLQKFLGVAFSIAGLWLLIK